MTREESKDAHQRLETTNKQFLVSKSTCKLSVWGDGVTETSFKSLSDDHVFLSRLQYLPEAAFSVPLRRRASVTAGQKCCTLVTFDRCVLRG